MRPQRTEKRTSSGYAFAFAAAFILSTAGVLVSQPPSAPPNFWCTILLGTLLFLALELFYPFLVEIKRRDFGYLLFCGLLLSIFNILWTAAVEVNGLAGTILLGYCSAAGTVFLGLLFQSDKVRHARPFIILLGLSGCAMSSGLFGAGQTGIMAGVLSGLAYGIYSLMGLGAGNRGLTPWTVLLYSFGFAALFLLIFGVIRLFFGSLQFFYL